MKGECGTSLVELLIVMTLGSVVATIGLATTRTFLAEFKRIDATSSLHQNTVAAVELIAHDVALAGCACSLRGVSGVQIALPTSLRVVTDLNADGDTSDSNERISYAINDDRGLLTRASGSGSAQPLLRGVAPNGFELRYFDAASNEVTAGDSAALRSIASIRITLRMQAGTDERPLIVERTVLLRNRTTG